MITSLFKSAPPLPPPHTAAKKKKKNHNARESDFTGGAKHKLRSKRTITIADWLLLTMFYLFLLFVFNGPCGTKFLRVLIFAIFAVFHAIRKNKFRK